jgi:hypothetical protein
MPEAGTVPNNTSSGSVTELKPEPAIETCVPPLVGPELGEIEVIVGGDIAKLAKNGFQIR